MWKILINSLRGQKTLFRISLLWDNAKIMIILKNQDDKPWMAWCTVNQACSLSLFVLRGCICLTSLAELKNFIFGIFIVVLKLSQEFLFAMLLKKTLKLGKLFRFTNDSYLDDLVILETWPCHKYKCLDIKIVEMIKQVQKGLPQSPRCFWFFLLASCLNLLKQCHYRCKNFGFYVIFLKFSYKNNFS